MPSVFGKDTKRKELINVIIFFYFFSKIYTKKIYNSFLEFTFNL